METRTDLKHKVLRFLVKNQLKYEKQFYSEDKTEFISFSIPVKGSSEGFNISICPNHFIRDYKDEKKTLEPNEGFYISLNPWVYDKKDAKVHKRILTIALAEFPKSVVFFNDDGFDLNPFSIAKNIKTYSGCTNDPDYMWNILNEYIKD